MSIFRHLAPRTRRKRAPISETETRIHRKGPNDCPGGIRHNRRLARSFQG